MNQLSMFEAEESGPPVATGGDRDRVRRKLDAMLGEARSAATFGLTDNRRRFIETVVPQMVRWLPEDEAARVREAFRQALAG